jgi:hypothetical protein
MLEVSALKSRNEVAALLSHYHLPRVLIDNYQCASFVVYKVIHKWISRCLLVT